MVNTNERYVDVRIINTLRSNQLGPCSRPCRSKQRFNNRQFDFASEHSEELNMVEAVGKTGYFVDFRIERAPVL